MVEFVQPTVEDPTLYFYPPASLDDGSLHTVTVLAHDPAGPETSLTHVFGIDLALPELMPTSPAPATRFIPAGSSFGVDFADALSGIALDSIGFSADGGSEQPRGRACGIHADPTARARLPCAPGDRARCRGKRGDLGVVFRVRRCGGALSGAP
ncbi:MAG: hypothetical protein HZA54_10640 [Planctomycetes bacterium]|nr:hypothetical protein [Planctomycetota bacterium]